MQGTLGEQRTRPHRDSKADECSEPTEGCDWGNCLNARRVNQRRRTEVGKGEGAIDSAAV